MLEFQEFPKMARLSREIVVTEKLDGTNASIFIAEVNPDNMFEIDALGLRPQVIHAVDFFVFAGARNGYLPVIEKDTGKRNDNFGFRAWVHENVEDLVKLGPGRHFGEWWGQGIQRKYGQDRKRFSLFNTHRWSDPDSRPECCDVVPVLYQGNFSEHQIMRALEDLRVEGSRAAPGFMDPEGVVVFHTALNAGFKKTIKKDEVPKSMQ